MAGRVAGYLLVCTPVWQSIDDLARALEASRSAAAGAVKDLAAIGVLDRERAVGQRVDRVRIRIDAESGFDPSRFLEMSALVREALDMTADQSPERRRELEEMVSLGEFLAARLPALLSEWRDRQRADREMDI